MRQMMEAWMRVTSVHPVSPVGLRVCVCFPVMIMHGMHEDDDVVHEIKFNRLIIVFLPRFPSSSVSPSAAHVILDSREARDRLGAKKSKSGDRG